MSRLARVVVFWLGGAAAAVSVWLVGELMHLSAPLPGAHLVQEMACRFAPDMPGADARWSRCALPDDWDRTRPGYGGDGWYRTRIVFSGRDEWRALGVLLSRVSMNAELFVNGEFAGSGGRMREPVARNWDSPLYFTIPRALLHPGENELLVHVRGYANANGGLGLVQWGDDARMYPAVQRSARASLIVSLLSMGVVVLLGMIFFMLWLALRRRGFACFAAGALVGSVYIADTFVLYAPVSNMGWERIVHLSIGWSQLFFLLFMLDMLNRRMLWLEVAAWLDVAVGTLLLLLVRDASVLPVASLWEGTTLVWDAVALYFIHQRWRCEGDSMALVMGVCLIGVFAAYLNDWIPWVMGEGAAPPYLYFLGPVGFSLAVAFVLIHQLLEARQKELGFAREMREALVEQEKALAERHARVLELERSQAVRDEQARITRELHDGVGAHILGAMELAGDGKGALRESLHQALDELRMLMDSVDGGTDVHVMLGMLRRRLIPRLRERGVSLQWEIGSRLACLPDDPAVAMHLVRIVQEAIANSLRHGAPSRIRVRTEADRLTVEDDGCGFDVAGVSAGRGLRNIRWRAEQIGARCEIYSGGQGTSLAVVWTEDAPPQVKPS